MKIFKYDPKTGKRGAFIKNVPRVSWTGTYAAHEIAQKRLRDLGWVVGDFGAKTEVNIHVDAGTEDSEGSDISYLCDEWICFCTGEWKIGTDIVWCWVILPSKQAIEEAKLSN